MDDSQKKTTVDWAIPLTSDECPKDLSVTLKTGKCLFIVGANGSGKSALIQKFVEKLVNSNQKFRRISAHRQTSIESGRNSFTDKSRKDFEQNRAGYDRDGTARYQDHWLSNDRQKAILFDLIAKENEQSRHIRKLHKDGKHDEAKKASSDLKSPFDQINRLLKLGTLAITIIEHSKGEEILAKHESSSEPFGIEKMSDGERNAVILAAEVLTVEPGTVLLIDEPERHLHRSIIEPFLSALFRECKDCFFVVSTHEIELPLANPESQVLMVRSCRWKDDKPSAWDAKLLKANSGLPEDLKRAILGSRKKILFVEGESQSLDAKLYKVLFPDISVVPKGGCGQVQEAVSGLRDSQDIHHVKAFGLIDKDFRSQDEVKKLAANKVFALNVYSVESLYYCSEAIEAIAHHLNENAVEKINSARKEALDTLKRDTTLAERMAAQRCLRLIRDQLLVRVPKDWKSIKDKNDQSIEISVDSQYPDELKRFKKLVEEDNLDDIVAHYPIRKSNFCKTLARAFGLENKRAYEQLLIKLIQDKPELAKTLKKRLQPLSEALSES